MTLPISTLPDVAQPQAIALGVTIGSLGGYWYARLRRHPPERIQVTVMHAAAWGGTVATAAWSVRAVGLL